MFDLFAMLLCSVASFLFPIFASYKALKTSDPAQLTPWLMYWVVFSCCLLVESWFNFILTWVPFYGYLRLLFLLYLILPQTQGARIIYEERVHPFLEENEASIDDFIATSHSRLKAAGLSYFRQAIEYIKEHILNLPPSERTPTPDPASFPNAQSYTQSLLARFSVPAPRWAGAANHGADFYNFLAGAMSAATGVGGSSSSTSAPRDMTASGTLIPPNLRDSKEKMSFIATQRERLTAVMAALDREAQQIDSQSTSGPSHVDGADEATQRPPSGLSMFSALSKSRSEADFEKIEAESGAEEDNNAELRKRHVSTSGSGQGASWMPWGLGGGEHQQQQQHPKDE